MNRKQIIQWILGLATVTVYVLLFASYVPGVAVSTTAITVMWFACVALLLPFFIMKFMNGALLAKGVEAGATAAHLSPRERIKQGINHWQHNRIPPYESYNRLSVYHKANRSTVTVEGGRETGDPESEPSYVDNNASSSAVRAANAYGTDDDEHELPEDPTQPLRDLYAKNKIPMPEFERRMEKVLERLHQRSANDNDEFSFEDPELESLLEERD